MDPVSTVIVDEDTTFALMEAAGARGHACFFAEHTDVSLQQGRLSVRARSAETSRLEAPPITLGEPTSIDGAEFDMVFVRKDPPFDEDYLWLTLLLEHLPDSTQVINRPQGLRDANEKLYACKFAQWMPKTLVAAERGVIGAFVKEVGGRAVIKPVGGHGGSGVFALSESDANFNALIETVTLSGKRLAMVQAFIPEVSAGDKRILLMDGEPLGAIMRVPQGGDLRSNIHVGGRVEQTAITEQEQALVAQMRDVLKRDGLRFVGLDVIGGKLTEVNVTSPTGIQQASRFLGEDLAARVIEAIERGPWQ